MECRGILMPGYLVVKVPLIVLLLQVQTSCLYHIRSSQRSCPARLRSPAGCFLRAFLVTISSNGKVRHSPQYQPEFLVKPARNTSAFSITRSVSTILQTGTVSLFLVIAIPPEFGKKIK